MADRDLGEANFLRVAGQFRLIGVRRSDGTNLLADNFWTTDRTFIGMGARPVRENILHLLDYNSTGNYTLTYAPTNALDTNAPVSLVAALPASSPPDFAVTWTGFDEPGGSGLAFFDIYAAVNNGAFSPWLQGTTMSGAIYGSRGIVKVQKHKCSIT